MATYGNPHTLPPVQCASNVTVFTDPTLTVNASKMRKVHLDELRNSVNNELTRRGLGIITWTDSTITANSTKIRAIHISQLQDAIHKIQDGDCSADSLYCPQDAVGNPSFTDDPPTANSTKIKATHISQMRTTVNSLKVSCICEAEQCQYCADCGYYYTTCSYTTCQCDDHKYSECGYSLNHYWSCGSINLALATAHPYRASSGGGTGTAWNGTVPWSMCNYGPPGKNWNTYSPPHSPGKNHSDWNCKCNPYTWTT